VCRFDYYLFFHWPLTPDPRPPVLIADS